MQHATAIRKRNPADPTSLSDDAAARHPGTHARLVQDARGLAQLAQYWDSLEATPRAPMQCFAWTRSCIEHFLDDARLRILVVEQAGRPVGIAPLLARRGFGAPLELLGMRELHEPTDLLYTDASAVAQLAEAISRLGAPVRFGRMPAHSPAIPALRTAYRGLGWVHIDEAGGCPYIPLGPAWQEPEHHFSARRRSDIRRAERHAAQRGTLAYEVLVPTPAQLPALLDEAYRVEAAGWKGARGSALGVDSVRGAFFRTFAAAASGCGMLRLCFLRIAGQAVAMQLAVEYGERFWLLKIGYDERFAECSPGNLLMLHTLKYAAARNLRSYEFLGSEAPWTRAWTHALRPNVLLRAYPFRLRGLAALRSDGLAWAQLRLRQLLARRP